MADLLSQIRASENYIHATARMGIFPKEQLCLEQVQLLSSIIGACTSMDMIEVTNVMSYFDADKYNGPFSEEHRQNIARQAHNRCKTNANDGDDSAQDHLFLQHYYPDWLWKVLKSDNDMYNKLSHTAQFFVKHLGIRNASANTKRLAVAIIQVASKQGVDPDKAYDAVHELQGLIVRKRDAFKQGSRTFNVFPKDPKDFLRQYPTAYAANHPPVECKIDEAELQERNHKSCVPTRSSNKHVNTRIRGKQRIDDRPSQPPSSETTTNSALNIMMQILSEQRASIGPQMQRLRSSSSVASSSGDRAEVRDISPEKIHRGNDIDGEDPRPIDAGGLPGCLQAPPRIANSARKMDELRHNIAETVANQKKTQVKKKPAKRKASDSEDDDDRDKQKKKRACEDSDDDGAEEDDTVVQQKKKKKAKKDSTTDIMKAKKAKTHTDGEQKTKKHDFLRNPDAIALLKKPAAAPRPKASRTPTSHNGGKIYFNQVKEKYRVYLRRRDKCSTDVSLLDNESKAFAYGCALIENDQRPPE